MTDRPQIGVTAPAGFTASGVRAGLRSGSGDAPDVALVVSDRPASAAAVYTTNRVQAAPLQLCRESLARSGDRARAVVVNAGCANACTGEEGLAAARRTAQELARLLGVPSEEVLVASTGVIGRPLPVERLVAALPGAVASLSVEGGAAASEAILTTDTRAKLAGTSIETPGGRVIVAGMAKGAGMVHPDLATTLAFVTTDAAVSGETLQRLLRDAVDRSFNRMTIDGDTSTNDMVAILANGAAGAGAAVEPEALGGALTGVLVDLARQVARDGEGASRLITVRVTGAPADLDARRIASTVAGSALVKTAVHGADANWGRVVAAAGRAGVPFEPERLRLSFGDVVVLEPGLVSRFSEEAASDALRADEVVVALDLGLGDGEGIAWGCDLGPDYVRINASYRS